MGKLDWRSVLERFTERRQLRTMAMNTPFFVRATHGQLVVTPSSGIDRPIGEDEFARVLPHIVSGAPRTRWKHLTNNVSYLEAIVEDLREEGVVGGDPPPAGIPAPPPQTGRVPRDPMTESLRDDRIRDLEREVGRLTRVNAELTVNRDDAVAKAVDAAEARFTRTRARLDDQIASLASAKDVAERQRLIAMSELADLRAHGHPGKDRAAASTTAKLQAEADIATSALASVRKQLAEVTRDRDRLVKEHSTRPAEPRAAAEILIKLTLDSMNLQRDFRTTADIGQKLETAAKLVFRNPVAAVDETRRAVEASARAIHRASFGDDGAYRFQDLAAALRESPLIPTSDWHLMKNLWSRASGVIHEGAADWTSALWIWLGTIQLAELVPRSPTRAPDESAQQARIVDDR